MKTRKRQLGFFLAPFRFGDPYHSFVSSLLHFNGADNSTTITDSGPLALTFSVTGTAKISTAQSKQGGSSFIAGTGQAQCSARSNFLFANNPFTAEAFIYLPSAPSSDSVVCALWKNTDLSWILGVNTSRKLTFYYSTNGSTGNFPVGTSTISTGVWHHIAASRNSINGNILIFLDGVLEGTITTPGTLFSSTSALFTVGSQDSNTAIFPGYIDELRITKGVGRYPANFTVPPTPLLDY